MRIFVLFGAVVAAVVIGRLLSVLIPVSGAFQTLEPMLVDRCTRVDISPGTEDVAIDPERRQVFVSAADRRAWFNEGGNRSIGDIESGIFLFDLDDPSTVRKVSPDSLEDFLPHGVSLWRAPDGARRLFVVNHPSTGAEIVEIFDVAEDGALTHIDSISFDAMYSPNDVVAVGPRAFYATNDRRYDGGPMGTLEIYLGLPLTSVVYYDGENGDFAASGLAYANGINVSKDGGIVYVAEFLRRRVTMFNRDQATGSLKKAGAFGVPTGPDNLHVDEDGLIWIGGHSKAFDFVDHAEDPSHVAPSHVVRLDPATGATDDVFISIDGEINASSVGAAHDAVLVVGAVFDGHVMVCPLE
ncbi:MAG: SMP-30/gluconolactonase/LRE family protein [Pseudomonadota bacterium]